MLSQTYFVVSATRGLSLAHMTDFMIALLALDVRGMLGKHLQGQVAILLRLHHARIVFGVLGRSKYNLCCGQDMCSDWCCTMCVQRLECISPPMCWHSQWLLLAS